MRKVIRNLEMNIFFFIVNYKTDSFLRKLIDSINLSTKGINVKVDIHVIDNSQKNVIEFKLFEQEYLKSGVCVHSNGENVGYFGGIPIAQKILQGIDADCVIYCNADLEVDVNFIPELIELIKIDGIIAPAILTHRGIDLNPIYSERISKSKMRILKIIYSNGITLSLYFVLAKLSENFVNILGKPYEKGKNELIYASHGAMFIFSNVIFFKKLIPYPCFLFGEEIFIAEEAKKNDISIFYKPIVKVFHARHASIDALNTKIKRKLYYNSINYLLKKYY